MSKGFPTTPGEGLQSKAKIDEDAIRLHAFYRGKIETTLKCRMRGWDDFAIWYTPGVAAPRLDIKANPSKVYEYTGKWNRVAVVSDGTRVLGMGDIGPEAGLPVMEGKCLLFKYLGGVDAVPITLDTKDPELIIQAVKLIQPAFGGINREDISHPKCFGILSRLREEAKIPIFHDNQQGTATVTLAGLLNALKVAGKKIGEFRIAFIGSGAANVATARLVFGAGARSGRCCMVDSKGILHTGREDIKSRSAEFEDKWRLCRETNAEERTGGIREALAGADVFISMSKSDPETIQSDWVARMSKDAIVFALANPLPEIWPWKAKEAGARVIATGRSDFPNQVNNSMGFPAIFRGTLDVRAKTITDEMCVAAANALAERAEELGLDDEHILPTMDDREAFLREAVAVGVKAQEQGVAGLEMSPAALYENASDMIQRSQEETSCLGRNGFIKEID